MAAREQSRYDLEVGGIRKKPGDVIADGGVQTDILDPWASV